MAEVEIGGKNYRTGTMPAMDQFHVARRLLPVFQGEGGDEGQFMHSMVSGIAKLPDADAEFVIGHCLRVCRRQEGGNWQPVWNNVANRIQYDDIDLVGMIALTTTTLGENLGRFFPVLPFISQAVLSQLNGQSP